MTWDIGAHKLMTDAPPPVVTAKMVTDRAGHVWTLNGAGDILLDGVKQEFAKASDLILVDGVAYHQQYNVAENWWWYDFAQSSWQMRVGQPTPTIPTPTPTPTPIPANVIVIALPAGRTPRIIYNRTNKSYVEIHINKDDQLKVQP